MTAADPNVQIEVNAANDAQVTAIGVVNAEKAIFNQTLTLAAGQTCVLSYSDVLPELRYFQGRTQHLKTLAAALNNPEISIIGVRGDGGIGKSTLAARAFLDCQGFEGRFWVDVRTQPAITDLATRALLELGVSIAEVGAIEEKDRPQRLLRHLQGGRYLLAIDNLESVLTAAGQWQGGYGEFLERFRDSSGQSVLLLASREYPQRYYSWLRSVWPPLEEGLDPIAGAALLRNLEIQGSDEALAAASNEVRGHPLALTLIAGWIREASGSSGQPRIEQLEEVDDYFQVTGRHRGESNHSLQSVLAWSLERLSPAQQHLLTQLSVLRSWFTAEVAEALITETIDVIPALRDLERRSLVQEAPGPQYRLQSRIRDLVQQRAGDISAAHERAIQYFWQQRTVEFAPNAPKETAAEYFEVFYHQLQLQHWQAAAQTMFACNNFLQLAGGYQELVDRYEVLYSKFWLAIEQPQIYNKVGNNLGLAHLLLGDYQRAMTLHEQALKRSRILGDCHGEMASLGNLGSAYLSLGEYRRAIEFYEQTLELSHTVNDNESNATVLGNLGIAYFALGEYERALTFHQQHCEKSRSIGDRRGEAGALGNQGLAYRALGDYQQSISLHEQSLEISCAIGDRRSEANNLGNLGFTYRCLGEYRRAISLNEKALGISRAIGDRRGEADALSNLGSAYFSLGEYRRAISFHEQSLEIRCAIGDRGGEASTLGNLGSAYDALGDYQRAIAFYEQSLEISCATGNRGGQAASFGDLGCAYYRLGEYKRAITFDEQALEIWRAIGSRGGEANTLNDLGSAYNALGEYQQATSFHKQALEISRAIGDRRNEASALGNLGVDYSALGNYQQAITFFEQSLEIKHSIGDRGGEAHELSNLGSTYNTLGKYRQAISLHEQSLEISRAIGDRRSEAKALGALGSAYAALAKYREAIIFHEQSLEIKHSIGDRGGEASTLSNLGVAYHHLGEHQRAITFHEKALDISHANGYRHVEASALANLGAAYAALGKYEQAIAFHEKALDLSCAIGDRRCEGNALSNLGVAYTALGEYQRAISFHEQSLEIRRSISDQQNVIRSLIALSRLYFACGRPREGFTASMAVNQICLDLNLPLSAWLLPKWVKSIAQFAQRGKIQFALCILLGIFAFPFALIWLIGILGWRLLVGQFRR